MLKPLLLSHSDITCTGASLSELESEAETVAAYLIDVLAALSTAYDDAGMELAAEFTARASREAHGVEEYIDDAWDAARPTNRLAEVG